MADSMMNFFVGLMGHTATWLGSEPISYFTAIFLGAGVIGLVSKIWHINRI